MIVIINQAKGRTRSSISSIILFDQGGRVDELRYEFKTCRSHTNSKSIMQRMAMLV